MGGAPRLRVDEEIFIDDVIGTATGLLTNAVSARSQDPGQPADPEGRPRRDCAGRQRLHKERHRGGHLRAGPCKQPGRHRRCAGPDRAVRDPGRRPEPRSPRSSTMAARPSTLRPHPSGAPRSTLPTRKSGCRTAPAARRPSWSRPTAT